MSGTPEFAILRMVGGPFAGWLRIVHARKGEPTRGTYFVVEVDGDPVVFDPPQIGESVPAETALQLAYSDRLPWVEYVRVDDETSFGAWTYRAGRSFESLQRPEDESASPE